MQIKSFLSSLLFGLVVAAQTSVNWKGQCAQQALAMYWSPIRTILQYRLMGSDIQLGSEKSAQILALLPDYYLPVPVDMDTFNKLIDITGTEYMDNQIGDGIAQVIKANNCVDPTPTDTVTSTSETTSETTAETTTETTETTSETTTKTTAETTIETTTDIYSTSKRQLHTITVYAYQSKCPAPAITSISTI